MTEQEIAKLKAAGFSDADIQEYIKSETSSQPTAQPNAAVAPSQDLPEVDLAQPSQTLQQAKAAGVPTTTEGGYMPELMAAGTWAADHPIATGAAALGAAKLASKLPVVGPAIGAAGNKVAGAVVPDIVRNSLSAANEFVGKYGERTAVNNFNTLMNNYSRMNHDIRQYQKAGQQVPQALLDAQTKLGQQIEAAQSRIGVKPTGPVSPTTAPAGVATQAAESPSMLSRASNLIKSYGPALAKLGTGLQLALHSGELNAGEDEELRKMREREKQMNGGQAPNAINSGYAQQLRQLGR